MKALVIVFALLAISFCSRAEDVGATGIWITDRKSPDEPLQTLMVLTKSPAEKAGIKPGQFLIAVNGTNVVSKPAFEVTSMIRGPVGKVVTLEIADAKRTTTNKFALKRGKAVLENNQVVEITE